ISRYRPIITGGPNFAYDLCVSKLRPEDAEGLDLSSWNIAVNGAEPVRSETLERFNATFAPHGWDPSAWMPSYGLAEAPLGGTGITKGYWNRPVETEEVFAARLTDSGEGPYMRTGDYGFVHDGILYLTGRLKETMIFWGRNVYPQDVEATVAGCHESLRVNGG